MMPLPREDKYYRWQSAGFIQVELDGHIKVVNGVAKNKERVHVWSERFPPTRPWEAIHDHGFWFDSTILKGTLHGIEYGVKGNPEGDYCLWEVANLFLTRCDLTKVREYEVASGETYSFGGPKRFHDHVINGGLVTYVRETSRYRYRNRYVLPRSAWLDHKKYLQLGPSQKEMRDEVIRMCEDIGEIEHGQ